MRSQMAILFALLLQSCTVNQPITDPMAVAPYDFSLDVTVVTSEPHTLAHMRSSRFVVFPDGSLHHGDEEGWGPNTLPTRTRILSSEQMTTIWSRLEQMGMATSARADKTINFQLLPRPDTGSMYMIAVNAHGDYWNFIRYIESDETADPAFANLIRMLGKFAWATDEPDVEAYVNPVRYDLGGNPYTRYQDTE